MERETVDPIDLLGRSVHDERVVAYLRKNDAAERSEHFEGLAAGYGHLGRDGFSLSADAHRIYRNNNGEARSRVTGDDDEFIVNRIDFSDTDCAFPGSKAYPGALPFGLRFGDHADRITQSLGIKPKERRPSLSLPGTSPAIHVWTYFVGNIRITIKLTEGQELAAIYLAPIDLATRQAAARKDHLRAENRNIDPGSIDAIEALRAAIPTPRWREATADADDILTEKNIAEADTALDRYVDDVKTAVVKRSASGVYQATKRLVFALNRINARDGMIETLERDELGEFIDKVVTTTGFRLKPGEDLTSEWRQW